MANLKEIRNRIASVSSTMQITSAMKMVSAAKVEKGTRCNYRNGGPMQINFTELLQSLSASLDADSGSKFSDNREVNKVLLVAITSNRGLCGAFNTNIIKQSIVLANETYADKQVDFIAVGKKANDVLEKKFTVLANHSAVYDDLTFDNVAAIAEELMAQFTSGAYDKIEIVYNKFKNAATQIIMTEQFLPIVAVEGAAVANSDYIFEPSKR